MGSIYGFVKEARDSYRIKTIQVADGYQFSQYETIRTIELYHGSKFTTGPTDSLKREKPFYNITKFRVNVATRAPDLDTKDVNIVADGAGNYPKSFLLGARFGRSQLTVPATRDRQPFDAVARSIIRLVNTLGHLPFAAASRERPQGIVYQALRERSL